MRFDMSTSVCMSSYSCFSLQASDNDMDPVFTVSTRKGMNNAASLVWAVQHGQNQIIQIIYCRNDYW